MTAFDTLVAENARLTNADEASCRGFAVTSMVLSKVEEFYFPNEDDAWSAASTFRRLVLAETFNRGEVTDVRAVADQIVAAGLATAKRVRGCTSMVLTLTEAGHVAGDRIGRYELALRHRYTPDTFNEWMDSVRAPF